MTLKLHDFEVELEGVTVQGLDSGKVKVSGLHRTSQAKASISWYKQEESFELSIYNIHDVIENLIKETDFAKKVQNPRLLIEKLGHKQAGILLANMEPKKAEECLKTMRVNPLKYPKKALRNRKILSALTKARDENIKQALEYSSISPINQERIALISKVKGFQAQNLTHEDVTSINLESSFKMMDSRNLIFAAQDLGKLPAEKISHIVERMKPEIAGKVLLHLGDQKKSEAIIQKLSDAQYGRLEKAGVFDKYPEDMKDKIKRDDVSVQVMKESKDRARVIGVNARKFMPSKKNIRLWVDKLKKQKSKRDMGV